MLFNGGQYIFYSELVLINYDFMKLNDITKVPFELPQDVLEILQKNSEIVHFKKNANLIEKGVTVTTFYFLKSGLCRIYYPPTPENSREENLLFGEAGNIATSVTSFILHRPSVFSIAAVTNVSAYKIDAEIIRNLYHTNAEFCRWLLELSLLQLSYLEIRHTYLAPKDAYTRFLKFIQFKPKSFMSRVPDYHIASYLGITPTALSLLKARYARDPDKVAYDKDFLDGVGITGAAPD